MSHFPSQISEVISPQLNPLLLMRDRDEDFNNKMSALPVYASSSHLTNKLALILCVSLIVEEPATKEVTVPPPPPKKKKKTGD